MMALLRFSMFHSVFLLQNIISTSCQPKPERRLNVITGDYQSSDERCIARGFQREGFMFCPNGLCIPRRYECDGVIDCEGGHDELNCPEVTTELIPPLYCGPQEHQCLSSEGFDICIPLNQTCDGNQDCSDLSDEARSICPGKCRQNEFQCTNGNCIPMSATCNSIDDCGDRSDENIPELCSDSCTYGFRCRNGRCLPTCCSCDGHDDCGDNSDEEACQTNLLPVLIPCNKNEYRCGTHGQCRAWRTKCDKVRDCTDYSDEDPTVCQEICETGNCTIQCKNGEFDCANGFQCVPKELRCDGVPDCQDGSDEDKELCAQFHRPRETGVVRQRIEQCITRNGRPGNCVSIIECPEALALARRGQYPQICSVGTQQRGVMICCEDQTEPKPVNLKRRKTLEDFESICGISDREPTFFAPETNALNTASFCVTSPHPEIASETYHWCTIGRQVYVGGEPVPSAAFVPWMAALGVMTQTGNEDVFVNRCGGTLITDRHVLTAAHCSRRNQVSVVRLGELDLDLPHDSPHVDVPIKRFHVHPGFRFPQVYDDIAVVELEHPVTLSRYVRPACLIPSTHSPLGRDVYGLVSGWGALAFGGRESSILQHGWTPTVDRRQCQEAYGKAPLRASVGFPNGISEKIFCSGLEEGGRDACQGDSGSGFLINLNPNDTDSLRLYVAGVVTAGIGCGSRDYPGLYTEVVHYLDFIQDVIRSS